MLFLRPHTLLPAVPRRLAVLQLRLGVAGATSPAPGRHRRGSRTVTAFVGGMPVLPPIGPVEDTRGSRTPAASHDRQPESRRRSQWAKHGLGQPKRGNAGRQEMLVLGRPVRRTPRSNRDPYDPSVPSAIQSPVRHPQEPSAGTAVRPSKLGPGRIHGRTPPISGVSRSYPRCRAFEQGQVAISGRAALLRPARR